MGGAIDGDAVCVASLRHDGAERVVAGGSGRPGVVEGRAEAVFVAFRAAIKPWALAAKKRA